MQDMAIELTSKNDRRALGRCYLNPRSYMQIRSASENLHTKNQPNNIAFPLGHSTLQTPKNNDITRLLHNILPMVFLLLVVLPFGSTTQRPGRHTGKCRCLYSL